MHRSSVARLDSEAALAAWRSYAGAPAGVRAFLGARLLLLPLGLIDPELRALRGRVLSLGAGFGTVERYLAQINPDVQVEGIELDARRVALAAAHPVPRVELRAGDVRDSAGGDYDCALGVDLLHHVPAEGHGALLGSVAEALRPGGVLLVKDIARTPGWQHGWNRLHDRIVAGPEPIHCREPADLAALALENGFAAARWRRVARFEPYPHYVAELRR